ncbi:hypothetical protein [Oxalicibacterium faecigallinarum]|uniref:ATP-binding protein n=1 Tax=Oxalicibacterium faecigallinarum TaxID=573741 RepID=A0A8J3F1F6_9BURK|nr:hypothetical protein [Oxalicibacterium faecigallinarum]GGI16909.1 hypothetical protein GCM10008066_06320 [Oxalicibacterium faecigallinarum]
MKTIDGRLIVVSGASRCGKSTQVARMVATSKRVVAWDPEDQWAALPGYRKITTRDELLQAIQTPGHMRLAYVTGGNLKDEYDFLCRAVFYAGRYIKALDFIGEELADVSTPGKAPTHWGILVRRGLKRGINIYAISQRWAEADKTAIGNASEYVCFLSRPDDTDYVAKKTGIPVAELAALEAFEFIQYDPVTKEKVKKKLRR